AGRRHRRAPRLRPPRARRARLSGWTGRPAVRAPRRAARPYTAPMPRSRTWRRSVWPIYPGILGVYTVAMIGYAAALSGYRLPLHLPLWFQGVLELLVLYLVWQA